VNVLVVFTYGYSLETWNESGTIFRELSIYKKLHELYGIEFTFLTFSNGETDFDLGKHGIKVIPVYDYVNLSGNKYINYLRSFLIPFYLKDIVKNVNLIKQNQLLGSWISIIMKILYQKPLFIRTGYDMYKFSIEENKHFLVKTLYKLLTILSIYFSDIYSVSSEDDIRFLKKEVKIKKDIILRKNWILGTEYIPFSERFDMKLLSVGRLETQKNFSQLIKSLEGTNYILDIVGKGSLKDSLIKEAELRNVEVNFIKSIENTELIKYMSNYKYYVSTSSFEGNPKTILEAMSAGCVVIASDIPNHTEIIENNFSGLILDNEIEGLQIVLDNLRENKDIEETLSINGYEFINKNYSLEKVCLDEYGDYYRLSSEDK
jgi:glycosyltransferase involved in cell wall biosynthesis